MSLRVVVALVASVPAAWIALVLAERVPGAHSLVRPWPRVPLPRGLSVRDGLVYPVTTLLFALAAQRFDQPGILAVHLVVFTVMVALSVIDFDTLRLPDLLVVPTTFALLLVIVGSSVAGVGGGSLSGALTGGGIYFGFLFLSHLVSPAGMGFGDVKLAALMGLLLGWPAAAALDAVVMVLWAMLVGFAAGSVVGIAILIARRRSAAYPFGPFLVFGAMVVVLAGPTLLPRGDSLGF